MPNNRTLTTQASPTTIITYDAPYDPHHTRLIREPSLHTTNSHSQLIANPKPLCILKEITQIHPVDLFIFQRLCF